MAVSDSACFAFAEFSIEMGFAKIQMPLMAHAKRWILVMTIPGFLVGCTNKIMLLDVIIPAASDGRDRTTIKNDGSRISVSRALVMMSDLSMIVPLA